MADSGVTTIRAPFYWNRVQPVERMKDLRSDWRRLFRAVWGRPTIFAKTDRLVAAAWAQLALLPLVFGTPSWAARPPARYNSPPADLRPYPEFLRTLVGRYGPGGSFWDENRDIPKRPLRDWQLWNEPDHRHYWSDQPYARGYVRLARAARRAIKDADPGARVVTAGFADRLWDSITEVYRAGGKASSTSLRSTRTRSTRGRPAGSALRAPSAARGGGREAADVVDRGHLVFRPQARARARRLRDDPGRPGSPVSLESSRSFFATARPWALSGSTGRAGSPPTEATTTPSTSRACAPSCQTQPCVRSRHSPPSGGWGCA
jgi:hypothetical protein